MLYSIEYYYSVSLLIGAAVNLVLAAMLVMGTFRSEFASVPVYRRSRCLTATALTVFAVGFLLHWWFNPRLVSPLHASMLSVAYFHLGGMLLAMSHTSLGDVHYLSTKVVLRDVLIVCVALACYVIVTVTGCNTVAYVGFAISLGHLLFLTWNFYHHFRKTYTELGTLAEFKGIDHQIDGKIRWLYFSCHMIILFGIVGTLISMSQSDDARDASLLAGFIVMMVCSVLVFCYIYLSLSDYGIVIVQARADIDKAHAFAQTEEGKECLKTYIEERNRRNPLGRFSFFYGFFRQW